MQRWLRVLCLVTVVLVPAACQAAPAIDETAVLYEQSRQSVFQIRVIDLSTDKKSAIGSGFYISSEGHLVTNYHVVSDYVMKPDQYRVEHVDTDGTAEDLTLVSFDVIHDLAILRSETQPEAFLTLSEGQLVQGERVFSLGNPHDLGFTIIDGNYNGIMKKSRYQKFLFSASLNPGMSGGPAINHQGEVIGVNVSTAGNDLSFLVPVEYVHNIYQQVQEDGAVESVAFRQLIEQQLLDDQRVHIDHLLDAEWEEVTIGRLTVPGAMADFIKCWGKTYDQKNALIKKVRAACDSTEYVYLSSELSTGHYDYMFLTHESKGLNRFRLYHHVEEDHGDWFRLDVDIDKDDEVFTKPQCEAGFVSMADRVWKTTQCARQYKQFRQLFDVQLLLVTVDEPQQVVMGHFKFTGVTKTMSNELVSKFLTEIQ